MIIKGRGATIARSSSAPGFRFFMGGHYCTLELEDLTLKGGSSTGEGGGAVMIHYKSTLKATNCKLLTINPKTVTEEPS
ncbi:MAG: hypothetical protein HC880_06000 [Bacteroidia bacterium]|nr:hypothetical protein [Bacteroidia bacterium]